MKDKIKRALSLLAVALFLGACGGGGSSSNNAAANGGGATAGGAPAVPAAGDAAPAQDTITSAAGSQVRGEAGIQGLEVPDQVTVLETK